MAIFLTGSTGYIGSYVAARLLDAGERLNVLVRASDRQKASERLWQAWQLHFPDFAPFAERLRAQVEIFRGRRHRSRISGWTTPTMGAW